jgi:hypothetical protein
MGLDENLRSVGQRPTYDPSIAGRLRHELEQALAPVVDGAYTTDEPLFVKKFDLAEVLRCERRFVAGRAEPFEWSLAKARGTLLHKAQQGSTTSRGAAIAAPDLVHQAIERLKRDENSSIGQWLSGLSEFEIEELTLEVTDCLVKIRSDLPPIQARWQPRCESSARVELLDRRCLLAGKFDLALGMPNGFEARVLITDFKTGGTRFEHHDELRFYALLETLRSKVPPWRVAVYYVDQGEWSYLDVNENALRSAIRRVADGAQRLAQLFSGSRDPAACNPPCPFCSNEL